MRIGLMSDTHDRLPAIRAALDYFKCSDIDVVLHCGDVVAPFAAEVLRDYPGRLHVVFGNNDGERRGLARVLPQIQEPPLCLELHGQRVLVHHSLDACDPADVARADVVVTGHTHRAAIARRDGRLLVNPGECCGWVTGRCTVAVLDLSNREAQTVELQV